MAIVVLKLKDVKRKTEERPRKCPYCERETFQRWGGVPKPVKDVRVRTVKVYRYRYCHCKRTFRHYPEGISRADQSERLKQFGCTTFLDASFAVENRILCQSHRALRGCFKGDRDAGIALNVPDLLVPRQVRRDHFILS